MHAAKTRFTRLAEIKVREEAPDHYRQIADQWLLDPAEPANEAGQQTPGDSIGQQEVQILLMHNLHYR